MDAQTAPLDEPVIPATANYRWQSCRVVCFQGQHDTHKKTLEPYSTRPLSSLFFLPPTNLPKSAGWAFIPSTYCDADARSHEAQRERGRFVALTGDVDKGDYPIERIRGLVERFGAGAAYLVYSSPNARPGNMRWRIIIPLAEPVSYEDWYDAQNAFFDFMEADGIAMDRALDRAGQPVYLQNVPAVHSGSGTPLRAVDGTPLYFVSASSDNDAPGLRLDATEPAQFIAALRERRAADERLRQEMRAEAERRRAARPISSEGSVIDAFNQSNSIADMLASYGYEQSLRNKEDWRSGYQTGPTFATRIMGDKWVSLSSSDAAAGVGAQCKSGCYGDAYDLYVHYEHGGRRNEAWKAVCEEQGRSRPRRNPFGAPQSDPQPQAEDPVNDDDQPFDEEQFDLDTGEVFPDPPQAEPLDYPEPVNLWARYTAPPLPRGLLPEVIEDLAFKHGEAVMGVDPAGMAMAALGVCAGAIHDDIAVQVKRHDESWRESARLWLGLIGPPSTKKTPIMKLASRQLAKLNHQLMEAYERAMSEFNALPAAEKKDAPKPRMQRRTASDATIESLQIALKDSPWGLLSIQDELSGWFGQMDKYTPGKGAQADRGFWLQAFNGGSYVVDRVSRGSSQIPNLSISIVGGIQPEPIRKAAAESVDDGLIQRLVPVILRPARVGSDSPTSEQVWAYNHLIEGLVELRPPPRSISGGADDFGRCRPLMFTDDAREVREQLEQEHHDLVQALEIVSPKLSAHFGKYDGLFARLCVIWHCIESVGLDCPGPMISGGTAARVAEFMEKFIRPSAIAFYAGMLGLSDGHDMLLGVASYIVSQRLDHVSARTIQRSTRSLQSFTADEARRLCEKLESFGWLEPCDPPARSSTPHWMVNPRVHVMFAEKGKQDAERRKTAREALKAALEG